MPTWIRRFTIWVAVSQPETFFSMSLLLETGLLVRLMFFSLSCCLPDERGRGEAEFKQVTFLRVVFLLGIDFMLMFQSHCRGT